MKLNILFNYFFKSLWILVFILIMFIKRDNFYMVIFTIVLLAILTFITFLRAIDSRNQWRKIIEDGDVQIKDKIKF